MATDERLQIPGWWPTKRSASREDYVGTAECARCHAKKTSTQVTTPMAHAAMPAAKSDILREHPKVSLQLGPYNYKISRTETGSTYSVSDGTNSISEPVLWAFGLGNKGQTYVYQQDGFYYESRMSFYKTIQGLGLTAGHASKIPDNLEEALGRLLVHDEATYDEKCLACHITAPAKKDRRDHPGNACPVENKNCVACHMPKVVVPVMHAPFTDHRIRIVRPGAPYPD